MTSGSRQHKRYEEKNHRPYSLGYALRILRFCRGTVPAKVLRIAWITAASTRSMMPRIKVFRAGLRELGYVEGENIVIDRQKEHAIAFRLLWPNFFASRSILSFLLVRESRVQPRKRLL